MDKSTVRLGAPSLGAMCIKAAMRNVRHIWDFGNLPMDLIYPILGKVTDGEQLHQLELNSPQIADASHVFWHNLLKKKFMFLYEEEEAIEGLDYYKLYRRLGKIHEKKIAQAEADLRAKLNAHEKEKEENTTSIVSQRELPRLPSARRRNFGGTGSTAPAKTSGGRIMQQVRQQARNYHKTTKLVTATGSLPVRQGQIKEAPKAMVNDQRIAKNPSIKVQAPKPKKPRTAQDDRESRLMAIKNKTSGKPPPAERPYRGLEDLFDDDQAPGAKKRSREELDDVEDWIIRHGAKRARVELTEVDLEEPAPQPRLGLVRALRLSPDRSTTTVKKSTGLLSNKHGSTPRPVLRRDASPKGGSSSTTARKPAASAASTTTPRKHATAVPTPSPSQAVAKARGASQPAKPAQSSAIDSRRTKSPSPSASPGGLAVPRKKKPVDIFMRPKKVARR